MLIIEELNGIKMHLLSEDTLFSPKHIDNGTKALLSCLSVKPDDKVLDLCCGYGVIGIYIYLAFHVKDVFMCDINPIAIKCAKQNLNLNNILNVKIFESDLFNNFQDSNFSYIICNPPYHSDFSVAKRIIEISFKRLIIGGKLVLVTKRLKWYSNKLKTVFGGTYIYEIDGYYVFIAEKRKPFWNKKKTK